MIDWDVWTGQGGPYGGHPKHRVPLTFNLCMHGLGWVSYKRVIDHVRIWLRRPPLVGQWRVLQKGIGIVGSLKL